MYLGVFNKWSVSVSEMFKFVNMNIYGMYYK